MTTVKHRLENAIEHTDILKNYSQKLLGRLSYTTWEKIKDRWLSKPPDTIAHIVRVPFKYWQPYRKKVLDAWVYYYHFTVLVPIFMTREEFYSYPPEGQIYILEKIRLSNFLYSKSNDILAFSFSYDELLQLMLGLRLTEFNIVTTDSHFYKNIMSYYSMLLLLKEGNLSLENISRNNENGELSNISDLINMLKNIPAKEKEIIIKIILRFYFNDHKKDFLSSLVRTVRGQ